jgi:hypothetical protein
MTERPRDWDKELADIDRVIEKQGAPPPGGGPPALPPAGTTSPAPRVPPVAEPSVARGSVAMTWFWVALAVLLALALPLWPYGKTCGLQLFFYLGAATLALLAGAAGAINSWRTRRGLAHVISLLVVVAAAIMGAREVLPRTGYAAQAETWLCPSVPEPAPAPAPAP